MFVPTIKHQRVADTNTKASPSYVKPCPKEKEAAAVTSSPPTVNNTLSHGITFEEGDHHDDEEQPRQKPTIVVDPQDDEQILITLSTGKKFTADRYCPHAGADLSLHATVDETSYPPDIGPIVVCSLHYWEYALHRQGRGGNGVATIHACPVENDSSCPGQQQHLAW
ncbi:hypothetical protein DM01DRAFT_1405336 [Hesseltinella vesiculosa]|uniref:Rieske domain-containing protein n=1 Tax=Hesseltinella vesiculosa TaxID=101127 RepID=A0A1X2GPM2_9FUNG|nr:hypothetical protein DM01DRAFT_1405336 [Hesseltinella vesiculosa]